MTNLKAGQTWSNWKTTRRITNVIHRGDISETVFFAGKANNFLPAYEQYSSDFRAWIKRTGATLQETKP